jgi:esterase/lipase
MFDERQLKILEQSISVIVQDEKRRLTMMEDMLKLLQR